MSVGPTSKSDSGVRRFHKRVRSRLDTPRRVVLRDFLIFQVKLLLDGFKGAAISLLAIPALVLDLIHPGQRPGHRFYGVMRLGDRLDRWLSLYGIADAAEADPDGMFGVSRAGSPTLLGRVEAWVDRAVVGDEDDRRASPAKGEAPEASSTAAPSEPPEAATGEPETKTGTSTDATNVGATERGQHSEPIRGAAKVSAAAAEAFDRGLAVLDRAVDVLDQRESAAGDPQPTEPPRPV